MTAVIIGIVILLVIIISTGEKNSRKLRSNPPPIKRNNYRQSVVKSSDYSSQSPPPIETFSRTKPVYMDTESNSSSSTQDESIIDVTGNSYDIRKGSLTKYEREVPYWRHQYVYSYSELVRASDEQQKFYNEFKSRFNNGEYLDVDGNSNYYFILLFDFLENEFPKHKSLGLLEYQLDQLSYYYPKTAPYAKSFLVKKLQVAGESNDVSRIWGKPTNTNVYNPTGSYETQNYWGLGSKYKKKLDLTDDQVKLLNGIPYPENNFLTIEFCKLEVIKLFLHYLTTLNNKYVEKGTSIDQEFKSLANLVATKQYQHRPESSYYNYTLESIVNEIHSNIFKHAENAVREAYDHKRKLNTDCIYNNPEVKSQFESVISNSFQELKPLIIETIHKPSKTAELELNAQNTTRWKIKIEEIETKYAKDPDRLFEKVQSLGEKNIKNPAIENIFLEASKTVAKLNKEISLKLYFQYLFYDLKSATFDNRQLTKTIQKSLFKTNDQLHEFEKIVSDLINDKNLEKALGQIPNIYAIKRKKIILDQASIKEVQEQDSGTVELLKEYLDDEYDDDRNIITSKEINPEEVAIQIQSKVETETTSPYIQSIKFNEIQTEALEIFIKANFSVPQGEIDMFAKRKNVFRNQLIESINDCCYETLDDILIEEDDEYYQANEDYYKKLLS